MKQSEKDVIFAHIDEACEHLMKAVREYNWTEVVTCKLRLEEMSKQISEWKVGD